MTKEFRPAAVASIGDITNGVGPQYGDPGRGTLTGDRQRPTGNPSIDEGAAACKAGGPGCFMTDDQRNRLLVYYVARVNAALGAYESALNILRTENLIAKDDDLPDWAALVVDIVSSYVLGKLGDAVKSLRKADDARLDGIRSLLTFDESKAEVRRSSIREAMLLVPESGLPSVSKMLMDKAKKGVAKSATGNASDRADTASFLEVLQKQGSMAYQHIREDAPGIATDGQMLGLYEAFDSSYHFQADYEDALRAKVQRYKRSGVKEIGRDREANHLDDPNAGDPNAASGKVRDTVVVRTVFASGYPDGYAIASSTWTPGREFDGYTLRLDEMLPMVGGEFKGGKIESSKLEYMRAIEPEFADLALARHEQMWGAPPKVMEVDDSKAFWDPVRADRARVNKQRKLAGAARSALVTGAVTGSAYLGGHVADAKADREP